MWYKSIIQDTLKKNGKWSTTSLTMFTAWIMTNFIATYDLYTHGYRWEVFITYVGMSAGIKTMDSVAKKIHTPKQKDNESQ
jgi:hypothetical protein